MKIPDKLFCSSMNDDVLALPFWAANWSGDALKLFTAFALAPCSRRSSTISSLSAIQLNTIIHNSVEVKNALEFD